MTNTPTIAGLTDDAPCTDCDDTGIAFQTERRCACQPPLPMTDLPDRIRRMAERVDPEPSLPKFDDSAEVQTEKRKAWDWWNMRRLDRNAMLTIATPGALLGAVVDLCSRAFPEELPDMMDDATREAMRLHDGTNYILVLAETLIAAMEEALP